MKQNRSIEQPAVGSVDVVLLGEALICLTAAAGFRMADAPSFDRSMGGAEANTAIGLARLGRTARWLSRLGEDAFGQHILRTLRGEGVDVTGVIMTSQAPTGLMIKELTNPHHAEVRYYRRGSACSQLAETDISADHLAGARFAHLTGVTLALGPGPRAAAHRLLELCREAGIPVSFDPNFRPSLWDGEQAIAEYRRVLPYVAHLLLNEREATLLTGRTTATEAAWALSETGVPHVVVKRAADGVVAISGGELLERPSVPVRAVDPIGAGDAFNAGWLAGHLDGLDVAESLDLGAWTASAVVAHRGDYEGFPRLADYRSRQADRRSVTEAVA